jgi:hypothetical protein
MESLETINPFTLAP